MAKDILKSSIFLNGDFNIGFSDEQHIEDILMSAPGHIKNSPLTGVAIVKYINSPLSPATVSKLEKDIKLQLTADGATSVSAKVNPVTKSVETNGTYT